jgi:Tol biopolymer transport system component
MASTAPCEKEKCPGNFDPVWSPDGEYIIYTNNGFGFWELHRIDVKGSNAVPIGQSGSEAAFAPTASSG